MSTATTDDSLTLERCVVRDTAARPGRTLTVMPGATSARHLHYGRIILREGDAALSFSTGEHETGFIALKGSATIVAEGETFNFLWMMAANRETEDRLFGVVNVHPDFAQGGSGLEPGRAGKK